MGDSNFICCRIYLKIYIEKIKMFVVPTILITTPLFDNDDCNVPSITVTSDSPDDHQQLNLRTRVDQNQVGIQQDEQSSIFPQSLFDAARSDDVAQRESVEDFIASRLSSATRREDQCQCQERCTSVTRVTSCVSTAGHDSSRVQSIFVDSPSNQEPSAGASGQDAVKYQER